MLEVNKYFAFGWIQRDGKQREHEPYATKRSETRNMNENGNTEE